MSCPELSVHAMHGGWDRPLRRLSEWEATIREKRAEERVYKRFFSNRRKEQ